MAGNTTKSYSNSIAAYGTKFYYDVKAFNNTATSAASASANVTTPTAGVSVTIRYGDETVVTASGTDDSVSIIESGMTLTINADGKTYTEAATRAGLFVYTRGGTDTINIASSVHAIITLETIDGAATKITSAGTDVTAWIDSTDSYTGTGLVHDVASFAGGVSKAVGAAWQTPATREPR